MDRYDNNIIITSSMSPRYRSSTRYPSISLSENDMYIITQYGDRLDNLASQFYGDPSLWWVIQTANPDLPKDSLYTTLGYQLRIPSNITQILNDFELLNL